VEPEVVERRHRVWTGPEAEQCVLGRRLERDSETAECLFHWIADRQSPKRGSKKRKKEMPSTHISGDDPKKEEKKQRGRRQKSQLERFPSSFALLRYASLLAQGPLAPADAAQVRFVLLGLGLQKTPRRQRWKPPK
jgi:hypothetical protein